MNKRVIFSIDDARYDAFSNILPILKSKNIHATLNVTTDYVINSNKYREEFIYNSMTVQQVLEWAACGNEVASHGHEHKNTPDDIIKSIEELRKWGITADKIGFASPSSELTIDNIHEMIPFFENENVFYVRSGTQIRREGLIYSGCYLLMTLLSDKRLFWCLNRKSISNGYRMPYLSITVSRRTTINQIQYLINRAPDESTIILCFHSILKPNEIVKKSDKWYWDYDKFEMLANWLINNESVVISTMGEYVENERK